MTTLVDSLLGRPDDEAARRADRILALAGLVGQIALAGFLSLDINAPDEALSGPLASSTALAAAGALAVVAWACGRLVNPQLRPWLDTLALAAIAQFTGLALEGAALAAALAAQALGPGEPRPPPRRPLRRLGGGRLHRAEPHARARHAGRRRTR